MCQSAGIQVMVRPLRSSCTRSRIVPLPLVARQPGGGAGVFTRCGRDGDRRGGVRDAPDRAADFARPAVTLGTLLPGAALTATCWGGTCIALPAMFAAGSAYMFSANTLAVAAQTA
jgi:hypothetical protein